MTAESNLPLFISSDNKGICYEHIISALHSCGICSGDVLLVHSDISAFGKLGKIRDRVLFLDMIVHAMKNVAGQGGTILMPTFSYSFTRGEDFDIDNTPSTVGVLTEHFRKMKDTIRTSHPIFSVAVWGKESHFFGNGLGKDSFGGNSIFEKLHKKGGKIVAFGSRFRKSTTFLHYIEQMFGVPYRYMKRFKGKIKEGDRVYDDECTFFVRYLKKNVRLNTDRLEKHLLQKGIMKESHLGDGRILEVPCGLLFEEGFRLLEQDMFFFLESKPDL